MKRNRILIVAALILSICCTIAAAVLWDSGADVFANLITLLLFSAPALTFNILALVSFRRWKAIVAAILYPLATAGWLTANFYFFAPSIAVIALCALSGFFKPQGDDPRRQPKAVEVETPHAMQDEEDEDEEAAYGWEWQEYDRKERTLYVDGHLVETRDDWVLWYVFFDLAKEIYHRLSSLRAQIGDVKTANATELYAEWKYRYNEYRQLCIDHGIWNDVIADRQPFIPTDGQIQREQMVLKSIEAVYQDIKKPQMEYQEEERRIQAIADAIVRYLECSMERMARRADTINAVAESEDAEKETVKKAYNRLAKAKRIEERKQDGRIVSMLLPELPKPTSEPERPEKSIFYSDLYLNLAAKQQYKAMYSVGEPSDVDTHTNTATFESLVDGTLYYTSLESCTCPAFVRGAPCKHMVKLAAHLGYYPLPKCQPQEREGAAR